MAPATKKQQAPAPTAAASSVLSAVADPKFEWAEKAGTYVLRLALPGLTKDDFRVQVDGAGRLTVRGTGQQSSFKKVFQLPSAASVDHIAGRFEAGVLTLTVPKRAAGAAPTSVEEIRTKQPDVAKETKPKEAEEAAKEDALKKKKKAMDDEATKKTQQQQTQEEQQKPAPAQVKKEEELKPATAPPQELTPVKKEEEMKPKAPHQAAAATTQQPEKPVPKPEAATGSEKAKSEVAPDESLGERVRRHSEEERAKAAIAAAEKEAKAEREKKAACVSGWKERAMGELKGLTDMKWADGMTETVRKNKEVVAVGIAAFSLGLIVSLRLFRK